jgi:hypothetical protein
MKEFFSFFYFYLIFIQITYILSNKKTNSNIELKQNINNTKRNNSSEIYYLNDKKELESELISLSKKLEYDKKENNKIDFYQKPSKCLKYLYDKGGKNN